MPAVKAQATVHGPQYQTLNLPYASREDNLIRNIYHTTLKFAYRLHSKIRREVAEGVHQLAYLDVPK